MLSIQGTGNRLHTKLMNLRPGNPGSTWIHFGSFIDGEVLVSTSSFAYMK